ncbi:Lrp/AsnC ligand binding domain-containing protein [Candidatus Woesearchaeota archaeon]|nr:Lrp/AsnC ligand binding domain-containing protein [Candidatus Woesearchaeota archaeon]
MKDKYEAYVLISTDPAAIKKTSQYLLKFDKIENIHELYGQYDIIIKVVSKNRAELDDFCEEKIRRLKGIRGAETLIVSEAVKEGDTKTTGLNEAEVYMLINTKPNKKRKVTNKLKKFPQIERVHELYGQFDIILKIKELTRRKLEDFIQRNIRSINDIQQTETLVVADVP